MRILAHVSDLHFGRSDDAVVTNLLERIRELSPHLVVISGDLTQRARKHEFERAQHYLGALQDAGFPFFVIPGNHDITPLYNPVKRLFDTYANYRKYVSERMEPFYADDEVAIVAINSVTPVRPSGGHFRKKHAERAGAWLSQFPESVVKIVVTHHPIHAPEEKPTKRAIGSKRALELLGGSKVDFFLAGHYHRSQVFPISDRNAHHGALSIQAGTVSERLRGELPSFNVLMLDKPKFTWSSHRWDPERSGFYQAVKRKFQLRDGHWVERVPAAQNA